ncbi:MAG: flagellar hook-basal body complex protein FliE [Planctomycetota bacterium]
MTMDEIRRIQSILQQQAPQEQPQGAQEGEQASFKETLETFLKDVNHLQKGAEESAQKLISGDVENIHQVMLAMEEANTSFRLMMEMRNKILEAYREVMKMQV